MLIELLLCLAVILIGNLPFYFVEKKNINRIDVLDERLSKLDGGSRYLKKYVSHGTEIRINDLECRISNLECFDQYQRSQDGE